MSEDKDPRDPRIETWAKGVRAAQGPAVHVKVHVEVASAKEGDDAAADEEGEPASAPPATAKPRGKRRVTRGREVRGVTISVRKLSMEDLEEGRALYPEQADADYQRPKKRGVCKEEERPCPYVTCRHHLYLDVAKSGALKLNFPDLEVWEMKETCSLDVADRGGATLEDCGAIMNLTRERVRQLEVRGLVHVKRYDDFRGGGMREHAHDDGLGRVRPRRLPVIADVDPEDE